jgi:2'-5' RNA ligase
MAFAVSLWFTSSDEQPVRDMWKAIHEFGISSFLWVGAFRPHVTLAVCEQLDVVRFRSELDTLLHDITPFEVRLSFLGCFFGPPETVSVSGNVVFLGVTPSDLLLKLHLQVHQLLQQYDAEPRPYYLPHRWNPHCSVAREVTPSQVCEVLSVLQQFQLPIVATANRIGLIDTPTEIALDYCWLGKDNKEVEPTR